MDLLIIYGVVAIIGIFLGKFYSDSGKTQLQTELNEAKDALVNVATVMTPGLDLGYNLAVGNVKPTEENLKQLKAATMHSWEDAKLFSKEVKDVLESMEPDKEV